jgi:MFS transporter, putative metabolite transport protein
MAISKALPEAHDAEQHPRSVQQYIDETPVWPDGTTLGSAPMTAMQWRIWSLAAAGKFFEGFVVFMTGVAMPLMAEEFKMDPARHGIVGAASLFGILVGAAGLGSLSDYFGRKRMFVIEMFIFMVFLTLLVLSPNYKLMVVYLFGIGVALGCDYPTAHLIISESSPSRSRGRLVLAAFGCQAVGALAGTVIGYVVLSNYPEAAAWRWMYATALAPGLFVTIGRFSVTESAPWLFARGMVKMAEQDTMRLLRRDPPHPRTVTLGRNDSRAAAARGARESNFFALFNTRNRRATILASLPWFLQDLSTYGIGIFTPTILVAAFGHHTHHARNLADLINNDILASRGAALIDILLIVGIGSAILLSDRVGRIRLQILGFIGCAAGLLFAALSGFYVGETQITLIFIGFMLFNLMTNLGPNAQTYLLAGEVFPTRVRGKGAGFAASFAKIGAVSTAYLFPIMLVDLGTTRLLCILIGTSLLGAAVTWIFRIETTGVDLETLGAERQLVIPSEPKR